MKKRVTSIPGAKKGMMMCLSLNFIFLFSKIVGGHPRINLRFPLPDDLKEFLTFFHHFPHGVSRNLNALVWRKFFENEIL